MSPEDVPAELIDLAMQDAKPGCRSDAAFYLANVLPSIREQVLAEAIDAVTTLQAQDADRYANGGGHGSWCMYGDHSHCHGSEAHATHERVLAALRAARATVPA